MFSNEINREALFWAESWFNSLLHLNVMWRLFRKALFVSGLDCLGDFHKSFWIAKNGTIVATRYANWQQEWSLSYWPKPRYEKRVTLWRPNFTHLFGPGQRLLSDGG